MDSFRIELKDKISLLPLGSLCFGVFGAFLKVILVATQVVEASVDADFDFMVTEISPIDSQIQRWGRVFRSRDDEYTAKSPNIVIFAGKTDGKHVCLPE